MKKIYLLLGLLISVFMLCIPLYAEEPLTADFVLDGDKYNIRGSDLLALTDCVSQNNEHAGHVSEDDNIYAFSKDDMPEELKGQTLHRVFEGDSFTFTVDFGSSGYESMGYYYYGAAASSVFELYIDGNLMGEGEVKGGNGWADYDSDIWYYEEIVFDKKYTGIHELKILMTESPDTFPANAFGKFTFNYDAEEGSSDDTVDFVLDKDEYNIKASDLITKADFAEDPTQFDRTGLAVTGFCQYEVPAEIKGQMLFNVGAGDSFTFTADFGSEGYESMGFYSYGAASETVFELYVDGELIGEGWAVGGNGWADTDSSVWNYEEVVFDKKITGVHEVQLVVIMSTPTWPSNVFGNFMFYMSSEETPDETPETTLETTPEATPENTQSVTETPGTDVTATPVPSISATNDNTGGNSDVSDSEGSSAVIWIVVAAAILIAAAVIIVIVIRKKRS